MGQGGRARPYPPGQSQGQYQGAYAMGRQLGDLVAPLLLTTVAVSWGWPGWLLVAALFLIAGLLIPGTVAGHRANATQLAL